MMYISKLTMRYLIELVCGILFALPLLFVISHIEKRFIVRMKRTGKIILCCRVISWTILLHFIGNTILSLMISPMKSDFSNESKSDNVATSVYVSVKLFRLICMLTGHYLGQLFFPIALTGSIATGKSTVSKMLLDTHNSTTNNQQKTFRVIDTDAIGHEILLSPIKLSSSSVDGEKYMIRPRYSIYPKILKAFGDKNNSNKNILNDDGEIDRRKLGDIIFQDRSKRRILNGLTHPQIIYILLKEIIIGVYCMPEPIVCADVPLLFESGSIRWLFGLIVVVACTPDIQYERLRSRNKDLTEQQCRQRISSQFPIERKVVAADFVIWNDGTIHDLMANVQTTTTQIVARLNQSLLSWRMYLLIALGFLSSSISFSF